jgi:hypothetical protein
MSKGLAKKNLGIEGYYYRKQNYERMILFRKQNYERMILFIKSEKIIVGISIHPAFYFLVYSS